VPTFTPPVAIDNPPFLPETPRGPALSLFRHYRPRARGINVFLLSDGTYVQDTASAENSNTNIPYPWNIDDPGGPFSTVTNWDGTVTSVSQDPYIVKVYYGGHDNPITADEAASLTAAGYGGLIS
jgi:hypothetical protein